MGRWVGNQGVWVGGMTALLYASAQAATPNAGSLQAQSQVPEPPAQVAPAPALAAPAVPNPSLPSTTSLPAFRLAGWHFTGNTLVSSADLAHVAGLTGQGVTLASLNEAATRVTAYYRNLGYLVATAYLPQQEIKNGIVTMAILEGRLGTVDVHNRSGLSTQQLARTLATGMTPGGVMTRDATNRALLLAQDLPGAGVVSAGLHAGESVGTADLDVTASGAPTITGDVGIDNHGNTFTGKNRLTAALNAANLAGIGDDLAATLAASAHGGLAYGNVTWDAPVGYNGLRLGAGLSDTHYTLSGPFSVLDAYGDAKAITIYGTYPVILRPDERVTARVSLNQNQLHDVTGAIGSVNQRHLDSLVGTLSASAATLGGVATGSATTTLGRADVPASADPLNTRGNYAKLVLAGGFSHALPHSFAASANARVQSASQNLDASEQMMLGGADGLRGYPQGEAAGDVGWTTTLTLSYALCPHATARVFHDDGAISVNKSPLPNTINDRHLADNGVGLDLTYRKLTATLDAAWRSTSPAISDTDARPRLWASLGWSF